MVLTIKEPNIITEFFGPFFLTIKELKYFNGTNVLNFKDIVILIIVLKSILNDKYLFKIYNKMRNVIYTIFS